MPHPHAELNRQIRAAGLQQRAKNARLKGREHYFDRNARENLQKNAIPAPASLTPIVSPEHYHLTYTCEGREVPHFAVAYPRQRPAYLEVLRMAMDAGPNVEYFEDGRVLIETRLTGRTGLFRVLIGVAACMSVQCRLRGTGLILPPSAHVRKEILV